MSAAETLSFKAAAERLNVTVSAISHRIHALEDEIGLRLFVREGRVLSLTPAGMAYRDRLLPIIDELQRASQVIFSATESQVIRIASFHMFNAHWLAPRIGSFFAIHPEADIELLTLRRRKVIHPDITIRNCRVGEVGADSEQLFDWNVSPICRPELVKIYGLQSPLDLAHAPLIETASALDVWPRWLDAAGVPADMPRRTLIVDSPSLQMDLIVLGVGVGITADFLAQRYLENGLVRPFDISCLYPGGVYMNRAMDFERPIVMAFRKWLAQEVALCR